MTRNDIQTYTVLELSTIHEDWHKWVFPLSHEKEAVDKLEELTLYGYEDLRLYKVTYRSSNGDVLNQTLVNETMAIYG